MAKNKSQYDSTLNLPKTLFEMRAGLPKKEPVMLKDWDDNDLYNTQTWCQTCNSLSSTHHRLVHQILTGNCRNGTGNKCKKGKTDYDDQQRSFASNFL